MTAAEVATCHVPEDPISPIPAGGYVIAWMAFYEWQFGVPSLQFLHSLLQFYGLELHHLNPLGIMQMVARHTWFLSQNRILILCVPRNQVYTHTV
jgi:hypothetical protein